MARRPRPAPARRPRPAPARRPRPAPARRRRPCSHRLASAPARPASTSARYRPDQPFAATGRIQHEPYRPGATGLSAARFELWHPHATSPPSRPVWPAATPGPRTADTVDGVKPTAARLFLLGAAVLAAA